MSEILEELGVVALPNGSTSAPAIRPDLAAGADNRDALDRDPAAVGPARPAEPTEPPEGEQRAAEDVAASLAVANAKAGVRLAGELQPALPPVPEDPLKRFWRLG